MQTIPEGVFPILDRSPVRNMDVFSGKNFAVISPVYGLNGIYKVKLMEKYAYWKFTTPSPRIFYIPQNRGQFADFLPSGDPIYPLSVRYYAGNILHGRCKYPELVYETCIEFSRQCGFEAMRTAIFVPIQDLRLDSIQSIDTPETTESTESIDYESTE